MTVSPLALHGTLEDQKECPYCGARLKSHGLSRRTRDGQRVGKFTLEFACGVTMTQGVAYDQAGQVLLAGPAMVTHYVAQRRSKYPIKVLRKLCNALCSREGSDE